MDGEFGREGRGEWLFGFLDTEGWVVVSVLFCFFCDFLGQGKERYVFGFIQGY